MMMIVFIIRAVPIRIPNRNSHTQCVTFATNTKYLNFWICDLGHTLWFFLFFWIWSHFGHVTMVTMSQMVTDSNATGTDLFLFLFRLKWFRMNKIRENTLESELCFCFLFNPDRNGFHSQSWKLDNSVVGKGVTAARRLSSLNVWFYTIWSHFSLFFILWNSIHFWM